VEGLGRRDHLVDHDIFAFKSSVQVVRGVGDDSDGVGAFQVEQHIPLEVLEDVVDLPFFSPKRIVRFGHLLLGSCQHVLLGKIGFSGGTPEFLAAGPDSHDVDLRYVIHDRADRLASSPQLVVHPVQELLPVVVIVQDIVAQPVHACFENVEDPFGVY